MSEVNRSTERAFTEAEAQGCTVIRDSRNLLLLDFDDAESLEIYDQLLPLLQEKIGAVVLAKWKSKSGVGKHIILQLDKELPVLERLLLQACLGSDRKREMLSLFRVWEGNQSPSLLFKPIAPIKEKKRK